MSSISSASLLSYKQLNGQEAVRLTTIFTATAYFTTKIFTVININPIAAATFIGVAIITNIVGDKIFNSDLMGLVTIGALFIAFQAANYFAAFTIAHSIITFGMSSISGLAIYIICNVGSSL